MSFETILFLSLVTEVVVISAIVLTLLNAFTDGYLVASILRLRRATRPMPTSSRQEPSVLKESYYAQDFAGRRAA